MFFSSSFNKYVSPRTSNAAHRAPNTAQSAVHAYEAHRPSPGIGSVAAGTPAPIGYDAKAELRNQFHGPRTFKDGAGNTRYTSAWAEFLKQNRGAAPATGGNTSAGTGTGTAAPAAPTSGVFFNPTSPTLWSVKNADGTISDYTLPDNLDGLTFLDDNAKGATGKDAAYWYQASNWQARLDNALRGTLRERGEIADGSLAASKRADALKLWTRDADSAMASAAQRGVYDSGMRLDTGQKLAADKDEAYDLINRQWGIDGPTSRLAQLDNSISDTRSTFGNDFVTQILLPNHQHDLDLATMLAAQGGDEGGAAPAAGGGGGGGAAATTPAKAMTIEQARAAFKGPRTFKDGKGQTRYTSAWAEFLKKNGVKG